MAYTDCKLLWESAKFGDVLYYETLLRNKALLEDEIPAYINKKDPYDFYTPLIVACKNGFTRIVEILCELGADLNLQGGWNKSTALIKATEKGYTDVVDVLLKRNVETDLCNTFDSTALMIASEKGYTEIVRKLLQIGVNTQLRNKDGYTALILAAEMGHLTCVKLLLQDKATATDIDVSNKFGKNALMMAAENGHYFVVEYLVSKGANVEAESKRGATAIILASMKGHIDVVVNLTPKADIYKRNNNGENAVSTACQNGFVEIVRHLLDYSRNYCTYQSTPFSPNANQTGTGIRLADELDPMGNTLIMISCANGKDKVLDYLFQLYTYDNLHKEFVKQNKNEQNAFTLACQGGHLLVLSKLLALSTSELRNKITNDSNILSILKKFYLAQPDKFKDFCEVASSNASQYYLFELLLDILPAFSSPISVLSTCHSILLNGLKSQSGSHSDRYLISSLISYAVALKKCSTDTKHANESKELNDLLNIVEQILVRCMSTTKMTKLENVLLAVSGKSFSESTENNVHNFAQYRAIVFSKGPLVAYIRYELTSLLETAQVSTLMDVTFIKSINPRKLENIHTTSDFFVLRTNCNSVRRTPAAIFFIEGILKLLMLILLGYIVTFIYANNDGSSCSRHVSYNYTSSHDFSSDYNSTDYTDICIDIKTSNIYYHVKLFNNLRSYVNCNINIFEGFTFIYVFARAINFIGELSGENEYYKLKHLDQWNGFDVLSLVLLLLWTFLKLPVLSLLFGNIFGFSNLYSISHRLLALAIISIFLGLLKFTLLHQQLGQLTIMIFRVIRDLKWISMLFILSILVFSIPFSSLFPQMFGSLEKTYLTLFAASLGNHEITHFDDPIGQILFYVFIILQNVVLFNLVLARLSSSHEEMEKKSWGERALLRAHVLREYLVYVDRNPLCMLPPPLNLVPATYYFWLRCLYKENYKVSKDAAGRLSDVFLSILTSSVYTFEECDRCITTMEYEGLARDKIPFKASYYRYIWLYLYYLQKICKEAFDTKIFVPNNDSDEIEVEPTIESQSAVNPLIRNSSFDIGLNVNIPNHVTFSDNSVPIRSASISTNGHSRVHNSNHYDNFSQPFAFRANITIPHSISNDNYNNGTGNNTNSNSNNQFTTLRYPAPDSNFDLRRQPTINSDFGMTRMVSSSTADELDQNGSEILFGVLSINIIRINELIRKCRLYEAKLRLFVRINFNNQVYTSKTTLNRGPNDPEVHFHDVAEFEILKLEQTEIIFEVYDSYQGVFPDRLLGTYRGSIKEWIANGRFEDSLDITEDKIIDNKVHKIVAGKLQINARMKYLTAEEIYLLTMKAKQKHQELFSEEDRKGIFVPIRAFKSSNY